MKVAHDGDAEGVEVEIEGSVSEFRDLGEMLMELRDSCTVDSSQEGHEVYPHVLLGLRFDFSPGEQHGLLAVTIRDGRLCFSGGSTGLRKLGQSLLNFFQQGIKEGAHFHLDYFEGDQLLAPTKCHLIFVRGSAG